MVILGSGGHTTEMLYMLEDIDLAKFTHRTYIISSGDSFSFTKAKEFEENKRRKKKIPKDLIQKADKRQLFTISKDEDLFTRIEDLKNFDLQVVPRARFVHQSLLTAPFSAVRCLVACTQLLNRINNNQRKYPDLILTNGPGTAVMVVLAALLLRFVNLKGANKLDCMRIIYVESWARIRTLSLTGRLLLPLVDRFIVQWRELEGQGPKCEYHGSLVLGGYNLQRQPEIER